MSPRKTIAIAAAAVVATTAVASGAYALNAAGEQNDALVAPRAATSLIAAITAAQQKTGGYATKAEYEKTKAGWAYDVEVVNGGKVFDVRVDAANGTVVSAQEDAVDDDHEDGEDKPD